MNLSVLALTLLFVNELERNLMSLSLKKLILALKTGYAGKRLPADSSPIIHRLVYTSTVLREVFMQLLRHPWRSCARDRTALEF